MKPMFPLFLAAMFVAGPAFPQAAPTTTIDGIAAVVDEDVILRSELDRAVANVSAQYAGQPGQLPPRDVLEKQVLERLIMMRIQVSRAAAGDDGDAHAFGNRGGQLAVVAVLGAVGVHAC